MDLTEIQKQTIAQRLRDGVSIRAIAAEVGVHKRTVLLAKQKIKPMHTEPLLKKPCLHNSNF
jgi:IS30 family transposase